MDSNKCPSGKCKMCNKFIDYNAKCNSCEKQMPYLRCDPNNRNLWFKNAVSGQLDPVRSNIMNGFWMCNLERDQEMNSLLCKRNFFDDDILAPFIYRENLNLQFAKTNAPRSCVMPSQSKSK